MAAVEPDTAFGPAIPAKKIANVTGTVTSAASQVVPLTSVPMISTRLPATARPACATSLSFLVPPKLAMTSVANPPNVANSAICGSLMTLRVSANNAGTTIAARTARIAAGTDQTGFHHGCAILKILRSWRQQPSHGGAQRCHPPGGVRACLAEVVPGRLHYLQVRLDLGFGATWADDHPGAAQRVAEHVGRRQPGPVAGVVPDRTDRVLAERRRGSCPDPPHDAGR